MLTHIPIKVLIAEANEIYREGLRIMLGKQKYIEWLGEAENGREVIRMAGLLKPDVILMDITMPVKDGIQATKYITTHHPEIKIIGFSTVNEDELLVKMLEAGAKGYVQKNVKKEIIIEAIQSVYQYTSYYCPVTSSRLSQMIGRSRFHPFLQTKGIVFNKKEIEIMKLVCEEWTTDEIGEKVFLSARTVEGYRLRIQKKIQAKTMAGLIVYAIHHGIYKIPETTGNKGIPIV